MKNHLILFLTTALHLMTARTNAQSLPIMVVTGTVTNERNERVSGMKVELWRDSVVATEYTDSCGVFRFAPVEAGVYGISMGISEPGIYVSPTHDGPINIKVNSNDIGPFPFCGGASGELDESPDWYKRKYGNPGVQGMVKDRKGEPLINATLEVLKPDLGTTGFKGLSDIDGYFVIKPIPEGSYTLRVAANGIGSEDYPFEISAGEKTELNIKMTKPTVDYFLPLRNGNAPTQ